MSEVNTVTIACPVQSFHAYTYFINASEPTLIDTAVASSPEGTIRPALAKANLALSSVRWILLTHGHPDHAGGVVGVKEATGGIAKVAVHEGDAELVRSRYTHVHEHEFLADTYIGGDARVKFMAMAERAVAGDIEPDLVLSGGEVLDLGDTSLKVVPIPGHARGSVAYWQESTGRAFVGDSVQLGGGVMNHFPSLEDPTAYRNSLKLLLSMELETISLAHNFVAPDGRVVGGDIIGAQEVRKVLHEALEIEARIADAMAAHIRPGELIVDPAEGQFAPFTEVATELGYTKDPANPPSPFFITLNGYAREMGASPRRL